MSRHHGPDPQSTPSESTKTWTHLGGKGNGHSASRTEAFTVTHRDPSQSVSSGISLGGLAQDDPRVVAALEAYLEAIQAGHPCSRDEFLARHTDIADALDQCLSGLEFIQTAAPQVADAQIAAAHLADVIPPCAQLGEYRILREVGRGGMGVVYEAEQITLGRHVALKVLPFAAAIDPKQRQRFQIEAQAAAQLHHPHIVPIFGVGCDHGIHYYAMQFVEGRSLAAILHELRSNGAAQAKTTDMPGPDAVATEQLSSSATALKIPAANVLGATEPCPSPAADGKESATRHDAVLNSHPLAESSNPSLTPAASGPTHQNRAFCRNVARLGVEAADALDHAHGLGIVHRDIKPANLLIDGDGALWITDFGLARFPSDLSLTHTGDTVGTLRYMSPEQAQARGGVVDQRTDIYALGMTLYELLTLEPAFDGRDHQELLRQIALDEPVPPRRKNPAVPRDLETIVLKAIAKDPSSRYTTALELAADLRRFMDDQPILARRPGPLERTLRWAKRHKDLVVTAAAVLALALVVGTAMIGAQIRKTDDALRRTDEALKKTDEALRKKDEFIIKNYPFFDRIGMDLVSSAYHPAHEGAPPATMADVTKILESAVSVFQQAIELPPAEPEAREIIARAYTRLGYTRWMLSMAKGNSYTAEPIMLGTAQANFKYSIELLETLLAESPNDPKLRRYMADAMGIGGLGCSMMSAMRPQDAEPLYRRAIQIRRELMREIGTGGAVDGQSKADPVGECHNLAFLVNNTKLLADCLEIPQSKMSKADRLQRQQEAETLRRQLNEDFAALTARLSKPEFLARRRMFASELMSVSGMSHDNMGNYSQSTRRDGMTVYRIALNLDPENTMANNNLAWALTSVPSDPWFNPKEGLVLAKKAVRLEPTRWHFQNTLGVAAFRNGDWKTATDIFQKGTTETGGAAHDLFFLAMTYWHKGCKEEARAMFDKAVAWADKNEPKNLELRQFRAEAAALLGQPPAKPTPKPEKRENCEMQTLPTDTVQKANSEANEIVGPVS